MALRGVKVVEIAGLAPAPFAGMVLADFGADVIRVDRAANGNAAPNFDLLCRGKRSIALDLKSPEGQEVLKKLVKASDVLIEPFRPGVMEKLGLGPEVLTKVNPGLIYARMTGFGQGGDPKIERAAGHDTNYLAQSGTLSAFRRAGEAPLPPVNLLADMAGGGMLCAMGILLSLLEKQKSGKGQVVDAAMIDGAAYLASMTFLSSQLGQHANEVDQVGTNLLDTGAHFYECYECKDGKHFSVGAIEPQFYKLLLQGMGFDEKRDKLPKQGNRAEWPAMKKVFADRFKTKTQAEWAEIFYGVDACAFPVLSFEDAWKNKHNVMRKTFSKSQQFETVMEPSPAPKLSRTPGAAPRKHPGPGEHTEQVLKELGYSDADAKKMVESGNIVSSKL